MASSERADESCLENSIERNRCANNVNDRKEFCTQISHTGIDEHQIICRIVPLVAWKVCQAQMTISAQDSEFTA